MVCKSRDLKSSHYLLPKSITVNRYKLVAINLREVFGIGPNRILFFSKVLFLLLKYQLTAPHALISASTIQPFYSILPFGPASFRFPFPTFELNTINLTLVLLMQVIFVSLLNILWYRPILLSAVVFCAFSGIGIIAFFYAYRLCTTCVLSCDFNKI